MYHEGVDESIPQDVLEKRLARWDLRFQRLADLYGPFCFYCKRELTVEIFTEDHFIPKANGGTRAISNLRPACSGCNCAKADDDTTWEEGCRASLADKLHPIGRNTRYAGFGGEYTKYGWFDRAPRSRIRVSNGIHS